MITVRRALAVGVVVAAAMGLAGCTAGAESEPEDSLDTGVTSGVTASGTSPIVFAFVCDVGSSGRTETYTTYSAVWQDDRTACTVQRITGTEMSTQQRAAVQAARGDATLEELAEACAVRGSGPWADAVTSARQANAAAGLLEYCPGHPETDHLRDAVAAWRG
ncbi:hypothetical protein ACRQ4B_10120 [Curtobacterium sp. SP.BCo]|uniref:hypothetical protein n=1 Tax=Curtobacterium sp. SP.BCo TaxID=3435229 RepID=UPI003F732C53